MKEIKEEELSKIEGGISVWVALGIGALVVFSIGVIDGFNRPLKCN